MRVGWVDYDVCGCGGDGGDSVGGDSVGCRDYGSVGDGGYDDGVL